MNDVCFNRSDGVVNAQLESVSLEIMGLQSEMEETITVAFDTLGLGVAGI